MRVEARGPLRRTLNLREEGQETGRSVDQTGLYALVVTLARVVLEMAEVLPGYEERQARDVLKRFEVGAATINTLYHNGAITLNERQAELLNLANETRVSVGLKPIGEAQGVN